MVIPPTLKVPSDLFNARYPRLSAVRMRLVTASLGGWPYHALTLGLVLADPPLALQILSMLFLQDEASSLRCSWKTYIFSLSLDTTCGHPSTFYGSRSRAHREDRQQGNGWYLCNHTAGKSKTSPHMGFLFMYFPRRIIGQISVKDMPSA